MASTFSQQPFSHDPSLTAAFQALNDAPAERTSLAGMKAVVIGGGTGAPVSIRTLLNLDAETSAVVAMADDGGSTGILRDEVGATAPGDVRKCITAMAGDPQDPLTLAFKTRFSFAENHTLGNLMLSTLEQTSGSFPAAIATCERLLDARGHVYPSTLDRVTLVAQTRDGRIVEGQEVACHSRVALKKVALRSDHSVIEAYGPAVEAIKQADLIVLGPGSLFTSIIPNLLVPGIVKAVARSKALVVFVCSLADMQGETRGMTVGEHYRALCAHGLDSMVDAMLVHVPESQDAQDADPAIRPVVFADGERELIEKSGTRVFTSDLVDAQSPTWHDPVKLRHAFLEVLAACRSTRM